MRASIVVPTYDRPRQLTRCLEALANLEFPRESFEVLVVDDASPCSPAEVVAPFSERLAVTLLRQDHAGPAAARNFGASRARGKLLAFTDDDCAPAPDWLRRLAERFADRPGDILGGHTVNALTENLYSAASQLMIDYLYERDGQKSSGWTFFTSNNIALGAARFRALGGFDTSSFERPAGEDRDFCDRWRQGGGLTYVPEAIVHHAHELNPRTFWRQHYHYGRAARRIHRIRRGGNRDNAGFEALGFYFGLLHYPLALHAKRRLALVGLVLLSQLAQTAGYLRELAARSC